MKLARGITGFRDTNGPPLPVSDITGFRAHCYETARLLSGRVLSTEQSVGISQNFVESVLQFDDQTIRVLLNAHYPLIAFATPAVSHSRSIAFLDIPDLSGVFAGFGLYQVLTHQDLNEPLTQEACEHLSPAERRQILFWRPMRTGEVIFNNWD